MTIDIDECATGADNCDSDATCSNTPGSFTCTCNSGYSGGGTSCTGKEEGHKGSPCYFILFIVIAQDRCCHCRCCCAKTLCSPLLIKVLKV